MTPSQATNPQINSKKCKGQDAKGKQPIQTDRDATYNARI